MYAGQMVWPVRSKQVDLGSPECLEDLQHYSGRQEPFGLLVLREIVHHRIRYPLDVHCSQGDVPFLAPQQYLLCQKRETRDNPISSTLLR